jgi:hypothetical protein
VRAISAAIVLAAACLALPAAVSARTDQGRASASPLEPLVVPKDLRVVSYYPADAGWTRMWDPWRPDRLAADLGRLRSLNANTVRIIVSPHAFGYPDPEPRYAERLGELVSIAAAADLHVQLTLFDWWEKYRDGAGSKRWASALLAPYVGDRRIAFVELRNELDPNDSNAVAWARELVPWLRTFLGRRTPVTLSVSGRRPAEDLRSLARSLPAASRPDFLTAHYFSGGAEGAADTFRRLAAEARPTPLWIGELGYPSSSTVTGYDGVPLTSSAQEAAQSHFLRLSFAATRRLGLADPGVWILDDFAAGAIPGSDVSPREPEYTFGLFHADGSEKAAAATVRRLFGGGRDERFNAGFEEGMQAADGTTVPATWSLFRTQDLVVAQDPAVARTGAASARFSAVTGLPGSGVLTIAPIDGAPRAAGLARASVWVRGPAAGAVRMRIDWFDRSLARIPARQTRGRGAATRGWTNISVSSRAPTGAVFARIAIVAANLHGSAWVDDVAFSWR